MPSELSDRAADAKAQEEPVRCSRNDGKNWRCNNLALPGSRHCAKHSRTGSSLSSKKRANPEAPPPLPAEKGRSSKADKPSPKRFKPLKSRWLSQFAKEQEEEAEKQRKEEERKRKQREEEERRAREQEEEERRAREREEEERRAREREEEEKRKAREREEEEKRKAREREEEEAKRKAREREEEEKRKAKEDEERQRKAEAERKRIEEERRREIQAKEEEELRRKEREKAEDEYRRHEEKERQRRQRQKAEEELRRKQEDEEKELKRKEALREKAEEDLRKKQEADEIEKARLRKELAAKTQVEAPPHTKHSQETKDAVHKRLAKEVQTTEDRLNTKDTQAEQPKAESNPAIIGQLKHETKDGRDATALDGTDCKPDKEGSKILAVVKQEGPAHVEKQLPGLKPDGHEAAAAADNEEKMRADRKIRQREAERLQREAGGMEITASGENQDPKLAGPSTEPCRDGEISAAIAGTGHRTDRVQRDSPEAELLRQKRKEEKRKKREAEAGRKEHGGLLLSAGKTPETSQQRQPHNEPSCDTESKEDKRAPATAQSPAEDLDETEKQRRRLLRKEEKRRRKREAAARAGAPEKTHDIASRAAAGPEKAAEAKHHRQGDSKRPALENDQQQPGLSPQPRPRAAEALLEKSEQSGLGLISATELKSTNPVDRSHGGGVDAAPCAQSADNSKPEASATLERSRSDQMHHAYGQKDRPKEAGNVVAAAAHGHHDTSLNKQAKALEKRHTEHRESKPPSRLSQASKVPISHAAKKPPMPPGGSNRIMKVKHESPADSSDELHEPHARPKPKPKQRRQMTPDQGPLKPGQVRKIVRPKRPPSISDNSESDSEQEAPHTSKAARRQKKGPAMAGQRRRSRASSSESESSEDMGEKKGVLVRARPSGKSAQRVLKAAGKTPAATQPKGIVQKSNRVRPEVEAPQKKASMERRRSRSRRDEASSDDDDVSSAEFEESDTGSEDGSSEEDSGSEVESDDESEDSYEEEDLDDESEESDSEDSEDNDEDEDNAAPRKRLKSGKPGGGQRIRDGRRGSELERPQPVSKHTGKGSKEDQKKKGRQRKCLHEPCQENNFIPNRIVPLTVEGTEWTFLVDLAKYQSASSLKERLLTAHLANSLQDVPVSQVYLVYQDILGDWLHCDIGEPWPLVVGMAKQIMLCTRSPLLLRAIKEAKGDRAQVTSQSGKHQQHAKAKHQRAHDMNTSHKDKAVARDDRKSRVR